MSEEALIEWLRKRCGTGYLGDDAAILPAGEDLAVTMDSQIEGVHFVAGLDPQIIARRLLRVNLSDLAAMGAVPAFAFLSLSAPRDWDHRRFLAAMTDECLRFGVQLAGGDTSSQDKMTVTMTLLGRPPASGRWLQRGLGHPGDLLWVGGTLGESALGCRLMAKGAKMVEEQVLLPEMDLPEEAARDAVRRHLLPEPQLELGAFLAHEQRCAALDLSDGLAKDLARLCRESGVGAEISESELPRPRDFYHLAEALGVEGSPELFGGEDYVLLFALPPEVVVPEKFSCRVIGKLTEKHALRLIRPGGSVALEAGGWDHLL